jgi:Transposase DDE domain
MRFPAAYYQTETMIGRQLPGLRPSQQAGLAWWVYGTILAGSACQNAVISALCTGHRERQALRQYLREWLQDGADKARVCATQVEVRSCFVLLLRWVLSLWEGDSVALAVDATSHGSALTVLVVSVLYRGTAIPVGWVVLSGNTTGAWMPEILRLLRLLRPAVPPDLPVLVLADRGLWSPRLFKRIKDLGWHPLLRVIGTVTFAPSGQPRRPARELVSGPGQAWVGRGHAFTGQRRRAGTLIVVWLDGHADPWLLLTDLLPHAVGIAWYGVRMWIELGFKALKSLGWHWDKTRRTDPSRVARHWLVLAVATVLTLATATRIEDATLLDLPPAVLHGPPRQPVWRPAGSNRTVSLIVQGLIALRRQFIRGQLWRRTWLHPEPWPDLPPGTRVIYHDST